MEMESHIEVKGFLIILTIFLLRISSGVAEGVQCGQPGRPVNGTVSPSGKTYFPGEKVTYSCLEGFILFGEEGRTCLKNGTWSGEVPLCDFNLAKGKRTLQSATLWSYVPSLAVDGNKDTCSFTPEGPDTRWWQVHLGHKFNVVAIGVTISPGSFQEFTIFVIELLANNKALYKPCTEFKGVFQTHKKLFKCNDGLGHPGQYVYIRDDRKDKEYFGLCEVEVFAFRERIPCGDPEIPTNGGVQRGGEDRAIYTCDMGHKLEGDAVLICSSKGDWQGHVPKCQEVKCFPPAHIKNGFIEIGNPRGEYIYGTEAKYNCNPGYVLRGSSVRVCGQEGKWLEEAPTCQLVTCGEPPEFLNAKYKFLNSSTGQWRGIAVYTCVEGFKLHSVNDDTVTTCLDSGMWRPINVTCVPLITHLDFVVRETEGRSLLEIDSAARPAGTPHLVIILAVIAGILAAGMIIFGVLLARRRFLSGLGSLNPLMGRSNDNCNGSSNSKNGGTEENAAARGSMSYLESIGKSSSLFHSNILQGIGNRDYRNRLNYMNRADDSTSSEGSSAMEPPYEQVRSEHSYETLRKKSLSKGSGLETSSQDTNYESYSTDKESIGYETVASPKEPGYEVIASPKESKDPGYEVVKDREHVQPKQIENEKILAKEPGYETVRDVREPGYEVVKSNSKPTHGYETLKPKLPPRDKEPENSTPDILKNLSEEDPTPTVLNPSKLLKRKDDNIPPEILALYAKVDKSKKSKKPKNPTPPSSPPVPDNHPVLNSSNYKGFCYTIPAGTTKPSTVKDSKDFATQSKTKAKDLIRKFNNVHSDEEYLTSLSPLSSLVNQDSPSLNSRGGSLVRPLPPLPRDS